MDRRSFLGVAGYAGGVIASKPLAVDAETSRKLALRVDVRDFGAVGDGKTDDTAAFNRACQAGARWSEDLEYAIHVPAGKYRLDGTVFVRKGQTLFGDGYASFIDARQATRATFVLGRRRVGGSSEADPGGSPVRISDLRSLGGAPTEGFIRVDCQGFAIANLFLTAVGIGLEIVGSADSKASDGILRDITIDQCLQGILIRHAQNMNISAVNIYMPKFALTFGDNSHDIIISSLSVAYAQIVGVTIEKGKVSNLLFNGSTFVANAQYEDFLTNILVRADRADVLFAGCTFRNWAGMAIIQDTPGEVGMDFVGCVFDGNHTSKDYDWSKASSVLLTAAVGVFSFQGCAFRGIRGSLIHLSEGRANLRISGGCVESCDEHRLSINPAFMGNIAIQDVGGFAPERVGDGEASTLLPLWPAAGPWDITIQTDGPHRFTEKAVVMCQGDEIVRVDGWCTSENRHLRFAIVTTESGSMLKAVVSTTRPTTALFHARTIV